MWFSKRGLVLSVTAFATMMLCASFFGWRNSSTSIEPLPETEVERTIVLNGWTYKLHEGTLYRVNTRTGKWDFSQQIYDPDYYSKNYEEIDGVIFRKVGQGESVPVKRTFAEDFEDAEQLSDLIDLKRGWTSCELQSPLAPTVDAYVKLRNRILKGESRFLDNRIELSDTVVHGGSRALQTVSVPPKRGMVTAKSSLSTELMHFVKGDDVWISMWCYVPTGSGMPFTLLDLETTWINQYPGIRIVIDDGKYACFQLKGFEHPYYRQRRGQELSFPTGRWVHLKSHLKLSEKDDGAIELWQDGQKIIDTYGQTLILSDAVYNSFEIGISAYNEQNSMATLYVDDLSISDQSWDK